MNIPQNPNGQTTMANSSPVVIASDQSNLPISAASLPLPSGAATSALQTTGNTTLTQIDTDLGSLTETAPATDTASSGLNGRMQRVAQRITSLIGLLPTSLGQKTMANSLGVTLASDQSSIPTIAVDATATGSITTRNLVPAGTATAGSAVEITLAGHGEATVQVTGTYTGALSLQYTVDGTNWITNSLSTFVNVNTGAVSTTIASAAVGIFQFDVAGMQKARITGLAAMTGTATITIRATRSSGFVTVDSALPAGANSIGAVTIGSGTVTTVSTITTNNNNIPNLIADVASSAITTTTTTAAFTPTSGSSYQIVIPVTVVSGTTPTMVVAIEESDDTGTNWYNRYTFPTISATGIYRSPILKLRGNRVRYVQTIAGTTPSFTRAISRLQRQDVSVAGVSGKLISAATTNATSVKPTPCEVTMLNASNSNASARFLKIYDKASAPTVGTDTPVATYLIPGNSSGTNVPITVPINFSLGFALAITGAVTDADTTVVGANEVVVNYNVA